MKWDEFQALLVGIGPETPLGNIVSIRAEDDPEILKHFTRETFEKELNGGALMLVDFWAEWCGPCRMLGPVIEGLADEYEGRAVIGKVNVDEEGELAMRYGVMNIPTVILFKNGREIDRKVGVMPGAVFTQALDENL